MQRSGLEEVVTEEVRIVGSIGSYESKLLMLMLMLNFRD